MLRGGWRLLAFADRFARLGQQLGHLAHDLALGDLDAGALEVLEDLAQHVVLAGLLDVGLHHRLGVFGDVLVGQAHQPGRPFAQRTVAPRRSLELLLLIDRETLLETTFTIVKGSHEVPAKASLKRHERAFPYPDRRPVAIERRTRARFAPMPGIR